MRAPRLAVALLALSAAACAPTTMYHWRGYDAALYAHYRNPTDRGPWLEALQTAILEAEAKGLQVPPGLYAEYGYALLEDGKPQEAVAYFKKERDKWPESAVLMEKMIRNAGQRAPSGAQAATGEVRP